MKGKKGIYILLPVVVAIWGIIGYKIYKSVYPDVNTEATANTIVFEAAADTTQETFALAANYDDPFLSGVNARNYSGSKANKSPKSIVTPKKIVPEKTILPWPQIKYKGSVTNQQSKVQVGLVSINNKDYMLKNGESKEGISIGKISKDSVVILFEKESRTFYSKKK